MPWREEAAFFTGAFFWLAPADMLHEAAQCPRDFVFGRIVLLPALDLNIRKSSLPRHGSCSSQS